MQAINVAGQDALEYTKGQVTGSCVQLSQFLEKNHARWQGVLAARGIEVRMTLPAAARIRQDLAWGYQAMLAIFKERVFNDTYDADIFADLPLPNQLRATIQDVHDLYHNPDETSKIYELLFFL